MPIIPAIFDIRDVLAEWRQSIHQHPELAFEELMTAHFVANKLEDVGIKVTRNLGQTGLVGTLKYGHSGKAIGLRADMDALSMDEKNNFSYKSTYPRKNAWLRS